MLKIQFLGNSRAPHLVRSKEDQDWLRTPTGMAGRMASGPSGKTCMDCAHLDLVVSRWSDHGRAAPCLETRRLRGGKSVPPVPINTPSCSRYAARANPTAALAEADHHLAERAAEKDAEVKRHEVIIRRLREEISEIEQERKGGAEGALDIRSHPNVESF